MSNTENTGEIPTINPQPTTTYVRAPKRVVQFGLPMLMGAIVIVLVLGFAGGLVAQGLFPAKAGPAGHVGKTGVAGPAGPTGPTGSAANINLSAEGLCFGYNTFTDTTDNYTWVSSVSLYTPTVTNGAKSCPTGSFVPLQNSPGAAPTQ